MTDVRLVAINPEDSSVVPIACTAGGKLLTDREDIDLDLYVEKAGSNMSGDLTFGLDLLTLEAATGTGRFKGSVVVSENNISSCSIYNDARIEIRKQSAEAILVADVSANPKITLYATGEATFTGEVSVGSRSKEWTIRESNGLAHLIEKTRSAEDAATDQTLRDVFGELDLIEKALSDVMQRLRLTPPAGWPVWDGSDKIDGTVTGTP